MLREPKTYDDKILAAYRAVLLANTGEPKPNQVTDELRRRGWLASRDTENDIDKIMRRLKGQGRL